MNAITYFPRPLVLSETTARRPLNGALFGAGTAALLWALLHLAFAWCWLTAGQG